MVGDVVDKAKQGVGEALIAGNEGVAEWMISTALSPPGLAVMGVLLVYFLIRGRR